ncbi:TolB family protein [Maribellus sediminis]|uniref:TolB family protein n=1 Tax=Maribellus sediminis TaxID=2696285 RepID=UPI001431D2C5|nr:DPP IV N-terminal domain-containing protein [Maribellus sediminis]
MKMKKMMLFLGLFAAMIDLSNAQPVQGTTPRKIISGENQFFMRPQWSPDGTKIAFTAEKNQGIWISNAKGNKLTQITDDNEAGFGFSWSADSKSILARPVVQVDDQRFHQVKAYDIESGEDRIIVENTRKLQSLPVWSNHDASIAFLMNNAVETRNSGKTQVKSASKDTPKAMALGNALKTTAGSETIEFDQFKDRYIFNVKTSPNGQKMVFQVNGLGLFACNADGTELKSLGHSEQASWMPDNRYIVTTKVADNGVAITAAELMLIDTESGSEFPLLSDADYIALNPSVSPDGAKLVFENVKDGAIYLMPLK